MSQKAFVYTGCDNLEAMKEAVNYNNNLIKYVLDVLGTKPKSSLKILDFGAGAGTYADMLADKSIKVDTLEPDKKLQDILKSKNYNNVSDIKYLKPNSYDVIYAFNVLEHIENDGLIIGKLQNALKNKGTLIIYVPAFPILFSSMDKKVGHYRRYKRSNFKLLAEDNGLAIKRLTYCDPVGFTAALAFRVVGNEDGKISPKSVRFYDRYIFPLSLHSEPLFKYIGGKNVLLVATKDE